MEFKLINLAYILCLLFNLQTIILSSRLCDYLNFKNEKVEMLLKYHSLIFIFIAIVNSIITCFTSYSIALYLLFLHLVISLFDELIVGCIGTYFEQRNKRRK